MLLGPVALFARTEQAYSTYGMERAMAVTREEVDLMLRLDQLYRPGKEAKKFVWSEALEAVAKDGSFFDTYALDSDERFHINEGATYYEMVGMLWRKGLLDPELVMEWVPAALYWNKIGAVLVQAREVFDATALWEDFEALAAAQQRT